MYSLVKREFVDVSPEKAQKYLEYNSYITQRKLRPAHVNDLAAKMKAGLFRFGEVALAHYEPQDKVFMLNGQHVCNAIIQTGLNQMCVVEEFKAESSMDLSVLFKQFEVLQRTLSDMINVEKHALKLEWPPTLANHVVASASIIEAGQPDFRGQQTVNSFNKRVALTKEQRVNFLKAFIPEGEFLKQILADDAPSTFPKHLMRAAVGAMMMLTWRRSESDAFVFWTSIRDGENLTMNTPEWKLREFLLSHKTISHWKEFQYRQATNHEIAYRSTLAWNAYREGRTLGKLVYHPNRQLPAIK